MGLEKFLKLSYRYSIGKFRRKIVGIIKNKYGDALKRKQNFARANKFKKLI